MDGSNGRGTLINSFALVSYLTGPLADFLNQLRTKLAPGCVAKAHVTVLPPRPLQGTAEEALADIAEYIGDFQPFCVELGDVEVFPRSQVIYLSILTGFSELEKMHHSLNRGAVAYQEPFVYHPHITLAQELLCESVPAVVEAAARSWHEAKVPRSFMVERLTFVQNTLENRWTDLATLDLASHILK